MNLNVYSRRVHDGYATIRSRGRPRAVYRSDSEELLKEAGGPYALPRFSNVRVVSEDARQVPRWAELDQDQLSLIENYGTLRAVKSNRNVDESQKVTLKTFSNRERLSGNARNSISQSNLQRLRENNGKNCKEQKRDCHLDVDSRDHQRCRSEGCSRDRRVYDTAPLTDDPVTRKSFCVVDGTSREISLADVDNNQRDAKSRENLENHLMRDSKSDYLLNDEADLSSIKSDKRTSDVDLQNVDRDLTEGPKDACLSKNDPANAKRGTIKDRQPIYAIPQVVYSRTKRECRLVDGNYIPSGDLYRTTAKYIEDINRNLAEIDKSYEEMKTNPRTYGVINRIAKGELLPNNPSNDLLGYVRKRDMAPMLPINADLDEALDDRNDKESKKDSIHYHRRPNSKGRLPPKVLPRSSSIENTSRHSTGSTTASSSKSTESLYAISETFAELPKVGDCSRQDSARISRQVDRKSRDSHSRDQPKPNIDRDIPRRIRCDGSESKDSSSSTDDDVSTSPRERLPVTSAIRRNRSRVDQADKLSLRKERLNEILQMSKLEQARSLNKDPRLKDRRCDTLPSRRSRMSSRSLHKSSEDVLDGDKASRDTPGLQRSCSYNNNVDQRQDADEELVEGHSRGPVYMMDATEIILKGQMERLSGRLQRQDRFARTRHNSLSESKKMISQESEMALGGFATLPRRGNLTKDQPDPVKRFSGNGAILEPLYEHAVSNPVKSRGMQNVIPWWELATRKYRHRSCPSLQVNWVMESMAGRAN